MRDEMRTKCLKCKEQKIGQEAACVCVCVVGCSVNIQMME